MAEIINNLANKSYRELEEALASMSDGDNGDGVIDIDGSAYIIPKKVLQLIDSLATENEMLKKKGYEL
jgi:hypothetical protein|tara:strand:- start:474 stop:677 length:204 start_codon:yes stop_codon:yes gene_type:complete